MVKIQDPPVVYSDVVTRRRRLRAVADGERFRMGVHDFEAAPASHASGRWALLGASASSLQAEQVEQTVAWLGLVGGILTDLGYHVRPIGVERKQSASAELVVWMSGDETGSDEYEQLAGTGLPGVSIGSIIEGLDDWGFINPDEHKDKADFIREFLVKIAGALGRTASDSEEPERSEAPPGTPPADAASSGYPAQRWFTAISRRVRARFRSRRKAGTRGAESIETCGSVWLIDHTLMRFCRIRNDADPATANWQPYFAWHEDPESGVFRVALDENRSRWLTSCRHFDPCPRCAGQSMAAEVVLPAPPRAGVADPFQ